MATAEITHSFTKVAGVTFPNRDGSSRQEIIQRCCSHEQPYLEPEPDNPADPNAIRVVRETGEQLGYLPAALAEGVAHGFQDGWSYVAFVSSVFTPDDAYNTYGLAVLARQHGVPFYVAAPVSTIDLGTARGDGIPIEERGREEVAEFAGRCVVPKGVPVRHPAFDITPAALVDAIITERGVAREPFGPSLASLLQAGCTSPAGD